MRITDIIVKAKQAKSVEELLALAKENQIELNEEEAKIYFEQMHKSGELSEEELENVSGGQCKNGGKYVVIATTSCEQWKCPKCGETYHIGPPPKRSRSSGERLSRDEARDIWESSGRDEDYDFYGFSDD